MTDVSRPGPSRLILFRHAEAEGGRIGQSDFDRNLTAAGKVAAGRTGRALAAVGLVPDLALVSSAARTRQTWQAASEGFEGGIETRFDKRIYEASTATLSGLAQEAFEEAGDAPRSILIVGHNPGLHMLAARLDAAAGNRINGFPTAAAAAFRIEDGAVTLERFLALPEAES